MCTVELLFRGPVPVGPFFPAAAVVVIDNWGTEEADGVSVPCLRMVMMLSASEVHHWGQVTG